VTGRLHPPAKPEAIEGAATVGPGLLGLRLLQYVFIFIGSIVVARALGPTGRAEYILPLNIAGLAALLFGLSLENAVGRLLGRGEATLQDLTATGMGLALVAGVAGGAAAFLVGIAAGDELIANASRENLLLAAAVVPALVVTQVNGGLLLRVGALREYGTTTAFAAAAQLVAVTALYATGGLTVTRALAVTLLGSVVGALALTGALTAHVRARGTLGRPSIGLAARALRIGLGLHPGMLTLGLNVRLDLIVVSALTSDHATGLYSVALTLSDAAVLASLTVAQSALHVQVREATAEAATYTAGFAREAYLMALASTVVASAALYPLIALAYGSEWTGAVLPCILLLVAVTLATAESPVRFFLIQESHSPAVISALALGGVALNLALNLALVPTLGITGAALGSLIAYSAYTFAMLWHFERVTGVKVRGVFAPPSRTEPAVVLLLTRLRMLRMRLANRLGSAT